MDNLFLFQFCLRDLFVRNEDPPCYARPIKGEVALLLGKFQLAPSSFHIHDREGRKWLSASIGVKTSGESLELQRFRESKSSVIV